MQHPIMYRFVGENVAHYVEHQRDVPSGLEWFRVPTKVIAYAKPADVGVRIVHPVLSAQESHETFDDFLQRVLRDDVPSPCRYSVIDHLSLPRSRRLRNAWRLDWPRGEVFVDVEAGRKLLVDQSSAYSTYWIGKLDALVKSLSRRHEVSWYTDALCDLPEVVADDVKAMIVADLEEYRMPFPAAPQVLHERIQGVLREELENHKKLLKAERSTGVWTPA